jgi:hypothetical protein
MKATPKRKRLSRRVQTILLEASCSEFHGLVQALTGVKLDTVPATAGESAARNGYSPPASSTNRLFRPQPIRAQTIRSNVACTIEARLTVNERFPALSKRKAADLTISESRISLIKEDDPSHSRQKDMPTASVAGKSRVDVSPAISHMMWKRPMLEAKLAQLRSLDGKLEENLRGDPSM